MKHPILIFGLLLSLYSASAQDNYIPYYNSVIQARKLIYQKNYQNAQDTLKTAFKKVDYVLATDQTRLANTCLKLDDFEQAYEAVQKAIIKGYPLAKFEKWYFTDSFKTTLFYSKLIAETDSLEALSINKSNSNYAKIIDSLYYIDQHLIRGSTSESSYDITLDDLPKNPYEQDSINFRYLLQLIDSLGFPSEQLVGYKARNQAGMLIHHNFRIPHFHFLNDFLIEQLKKGYYFPREYAWAYDQGLRMIGKDVYYYYATASLDGLTKEDLAEIDRRRKLLGIDPLESTEIIKKPSGGIRMNGLW